MSCPGGGQATKEVNSEAQAAAAGRPGEILNNKCEINLTGKVISDLII